MTFTPKFGRPITLEEQKALVNYGTPVETQNRVILKKPTDNRSTLSKVANAVTNFAGLREVADTFGAEIARAQAPTEQEKNLISADTPSVRETAGSAVRGIGTIAGLTAGAPATLAGRVAQGAALGYAQDVGTDLQNNKTSAEVVTPGPGAAVGAALPIASAGVKKVSDLFTKAGDKIQYSVIKPSQTDVKDGFDIQTVKKYNLGGSLKQMAEKADSKLDQLSSELNKKLADSNTSVNLSKVYERTAKKLLGDKFGNFGSNSQLDNALEGLRGEVVASAGQNGLVSVPEAQIVKRASGHYGAWLHGAVDPDASARQKVFNAFYSELKSEIEKQSPAGVREINKQLSELIPVMNALIRRIPVAERNNALSLTDIITLTGATLEPKTLSLTLLNLASKSGRVGAAMSKGGEAATAALNSPTAQGLGSIGATTVRNTASQIGAGQ